MNRLKITAAGLVGLGLAALTMAGASAAGTPTCANVGGSGIAVHGQHIVGDYVTGLGGVFGDGLGWPPAGQVSEAVQDNGGVVTPGGPGPGFHFTVEGLAPGASFCVAQAHPDGFDTPDNVPTPGQ